MGTPPVALVYRLPVLYVGHDREPNCPHYPTIESITSPECCTRHCAQPQSTRSTPSYHSLNLRGALNVGFHFRAGPHCSRWVAPVRLKGERKGRGHASSCCQEYGHWGSAHQRYGHDWEFLAPGETFALSLVDLTWTLAAVPLLSLSPFHASPLHTRRFTVSSSIPHFRYVCILTL